MLYVDESTYPIAKDIVEVFEAYYTNAKIEIIAEAETRILNNLFKDSVRLAIISRDLTEKEIKFLSEKAIPISTPIAREAVVFIQNIKNKDSIISLSDIHKIITEESSTKLAMDNINSSVIRKLKEYLPIDNAAKNTFFMKESKEVIDFVSKRTNAIGVISSNWLIESKEKDASWKKNIRVMGLRDSISGTVIIPSQSTIADKSYPIVRTINIIDVKGNAGLGKGFSAFAASDKGQRIILKSNIMPINTPTREILIKE